MVVMIKDFEFIAVCRNRGEREVRRVKVFICDDIDARMERDLRLSMRGGTLVIITVIFIDADLHTFVLTQSAFVHLNP
jgi:hypothetical protein